MSNANVPMPIPTAARPNSTGTLKMSIMLGKNPSVIGSSGPFYLIGPETIEGTELTGNVNLLEYHGLDGSYYKLSTAKKLRDELSSFLPDLPGYLDTPASEDGSSLKQLYENPPRNRKEIENLPNHLLSGFRLQPGPVPEPYRFMDLSAMKKQHKKKKRKDDAEGSEQDSPESKKLRSEKDEERRIRKKEKKRKRVKQEHLNGM